MNHNVFSDNEAIRRTYMLCLIVILALNICQLSNSFVHQHHSRLSNYVALKMQGQGFAPKPSFKYSGNQRPGIVSPTRGVPLHIQRPDYADSGIPSSASSTGLHSLSLDDISRMRVASKIAREVLDEAVKVIRPGITTDYIDQVVHDATISRNSYPSTLNYFGFPKSCCTSINEVACHGIPDSTILKEGDIINVDVTAFHDGVHGDCSETVFVGKVSNKVKDLVVTTFNAWQAAINYCKPGMPYSGIGEIIDNIIKPKGYSSMKEFAGHGIGRVFHQEPTIFHYRNNFNLGVMAPGHVFTIEPMICMGTCENIMWDDKWTVTTKDGLPSAQFEHTLLITENSVEELTKKLPSSNKYSWE